MKKFLLFAFLGVFAGDALADCSMMTTFQMADQTDQACFPTITDSCDHFAKGVVMVAGASERDIEDAKKDGVKLMNFANGQVCEKGNCGPYVAEFATEAKCDGKAVKNMPGGEYRGLTSQAVRNIQNFGNRLAEVGADRGKVRGEKAKGKAKGKLWGSSE